LCYIISQGFHLTDEKEYKALLMAILPGHLNIINQAGLEFAYILP